MKRIFLSVFVAAFFMLYAGKAKAQDEVAVFINESVEDAETVMTAYGSPLLRSL